MKPRDGRFCPIVLSFPAHHTAWGWLHRAGESHYSPKPSWALEAASVTGVVAGVTFTSAPFQGIPEELTPLATEKYLGGTDDPAKKKDLFLDMLGDLLFGIPSVTMARHYRGESQRLDRRETPTPPASLFILTTSQHRQIHGSHQGSGFQGQSHMAWDRGTILLRVHQKATLRRGLECK